ncbi:MAG: hypothetical protein PW786_03570 [Arachidicoccus sp.]|nr:hypothetical protein [Arachidicoccus sp.]
MTVYSDLTIDKRFSDKKTGIKKAVNKEQEKIIINIQKKAKCPRCLHLNDFGAGGRLQKTKQRRKKKAPEKNKKSPEKPKAATTESEPKTASENSKKTFRKQSPTAYTKTKIYRSNGAKKSPRKKRVSKPRYNKNTDCNSPKKHSRLWRGKEKSPEKICSVSEQRATCFADFRQRKFIKNND